MRGSLRAALWSASAVTRSSDFTYLAIFHGLFTSFAILIHGGVPILHGPQAAESRADLSIDSFRRGRIGRQLRSREVDHDLLRHHPGGRFNERTQCRGRLRPETPPPADDSSIREQKPEVNLGRTAFSSPLAAHALAEKESQKFLRRLVSSVAITLLLPWGDQDCR